MEARPKSASDVVREAEASLARAREMREEARRLLREADAVEEATRVDAIEILGPEHGIAALELARLSFGEGASADPSRNPSLPGARSADAAGTVAPASVEGRSSAIPSHPVRNGNRVSLHGIDVPAARVSEARMLIEEAEAAAAQGRKANPHANDRGKNAWRRSLFAAVVESFGEDAALPGGHADPASLPSSDGDASDPSEETAPDITIPSTGIPVTAWSTIELHSGSRVPGLAAPSPPIGRDPLDDELPADSLMVDGTSGDDDSVVVTPAARLRSHPIPIGRRPGYGAAVPKPQGLIDAELNPTAEVPASSASRLRPPGFMRRS